MFTPLFSILLAEEGSNGIPWWVWVILIIILLVLLYFWFGKDEETTADEDHTPVDKTHTPAVAEQPDLPAPTPDDLKKIEGVGPKVAGILNEAGITTFQQVVDAGYEKLESILDNAGLQMIDSDTWPEQAKLAAAGDWEGLQKLQDELKGGKRG